LEFVLFFFFFFLFLCAYLELTINTSLNARLIPAHIQGQQTVVSSHTSANASAHSSTTVGTGGATDHTTGSSIATSSTNDMPIASINRSNDSPPASIAAAAAAVIVNGPGASDVMNSTDEQTATGGDSTSKDRS
jgi:hypothetical protein